MKWKYISSKTRIYPKDFQMHPSAVTWSIILQMKKLANETEQFWKCDDYTSQLTDTHVYIFQAFL
jgi:hypothetical protein